MSWLDWIIWSGRRDCSSSKQRHMPVSIEAEAEIIGNLLPVIPLWKHSLTTPQCYRKSARQRNFFGIARRSR
jgi:hypothetical protein